MGRKPDDIAMNERLYGKGGAYAEPGSGRECPQCGKTWTEIIKTKAHRTRLGATYLPGKDYYAIWCHSCDTSTIIGKVGRNGPEVG
jgi:hypothetical protein